MNSLEIERKLKEYRAKKARQEQINKLKSRIRSFLPTFIFNREVNQETSTTKIDNKQTTDVIKEPLLNEDYDNIDPNTNISTNSNEEDSDCCTYYDLLWYLLCFILWVIVYAIFIEFQFGTVFLIVSGIVFMFINTRTGPRQPHEISAYSVFNKNCESIDGTLKAEQFENEIRYGPGVVR